MNRLEKRRDYATSLLQGAGLDAAVLVPGAQFAYLTGVNLHLMERPTLYVLTVNGAGFAVMPALEELKWSAAMPEVETFYWTDADGPQAAVNSLAAALGPDASLGVEGLRMRVTENNLLLTHWPAAQISDADPILTELRLLKDADEIADLRRAIAISEAALGDALNDGIAGKTERQFVQRLRSAMLAHGATGFAFDAIVLTGAEAANPHGEAGDRPIIAGQPLLIDFGASYSDMHADITRTVFCDHALDEHAAIYETVLAANKAGRASVKAGASVGGVDAAATNCLQASPFAELILHKTGHGLGHEVHEAPAVMRSNTDPQRSGMVFTIEPGLYRAGDIGVRIEDDVLVTDRGIDCLTSFSRELTTYA